MSRDPARIVIGSNRGPVAFVKDASGGLVERRGVGGLVTAVSGALRGRPARWVAAAITAEDRERAASGEPVAMDDDLLVRLIAPDEQTYDRYYNGFSNRVLWFLSHDLWGSPPEFGAEEHAMWDAYRDVNARFAQAMAQEAGGDALLLPQDYHLALVPGLLREADAGPVSLFWHIPFATPEQIARIPREWATALLQGMLGADILGFHVPRWAARFRACCEAVLGAEVDGDDVRFDGRTTTVRTYPIGVDVEELRAQAAGERAAGLFAGLDEQTGDRVLVLRADRTEPSKNIERGLAAYEMLLERRPDLRERIRHLVSLTPSRRGVPEYQEYIERCIQAANRIRDRFGTDVLSLDIADDFEATLAMFRRYDVLIVNPVSDGMNLVAREGPVLNERDGVLVLSRDAGAADELGEAALVVDPFDVEQTAAALERAVEMSMEERAERAARLRALAPGTPPAEWLRAQVSELRERAKA